MIVLGLPPGLVLFELWLLLCIPSSIALGGIYWYEERKGAPRA